MNRVTLPDFQRMCDRLELEPVLLDGDELIDTRSELAAYRYWEPLGILLADAFGRNVARQHILLAAGDVKDLVERLQNYHTAMAPVYLIGWTDGIDNDYASDPELLYNQHYGVGAWDAQLIRSHYGLG